MIAALWVVLAATPVTVSVEGCSFSGDEVRRLAELELRRGPTRALPVSLRCDERAVLVTVEDPVTRKTLARSFPREEVPSGAPERFAALAIAELVEASWSELLLPARPAVSAEDRTAAVEALPTRRVRLLAFGAVQSLPVTGLTQGGGGVRAHVQLAGALGLAVDLMAESGSRTATAGRVSVDALSGAALATARLDVGRFGLLGGLGARGFGTRLVGLPSDGATVEGRTLTSFLGGPCVLLEGSVAWGHLELSVAVEGGWLTSTLEARFDGATVAQVRGPWVQANAGLGWRW